MSFRSNVSNISKSGSSVEIYKGQSKDLAITVVQDGIDPATGQASDEVPVDLTGATVYFTVRTRPGDPVQLIRKVSTDPNQISFNTPATDGVIYIHLVPLDTYKLDADTYAFDVWVVLSTGKTYPVVEVSDFIVKEPVTVING